MVADAGQSDGQLVQAVLRGRREAFEPLVTRYYSAAKAYAAVVARDEEDAEDVVQEAFLRAYRSLDSLKDPDRFPAWFFAIVRNTAHTTRDRAERAHLITPSDETATQPDPARDELNEILRREIAALDAPYREAIALHYFAGKSTAEIGALLGTGKFTVQKRLQRARRVLGERLLERAGDGIRPYTATHDRVSGVVAAVLSIEPNWKISATSAGGTVAASATLGVLYKVVLVLVLLLGGLLTGFHYRVQQRSQATEELAVASQRAPEWIVAKTRVLPEPSDDAEPEGAAEDAVEWTVSEEAPSIWGVVSNTEGEPVRDAKVKTIVGGKACFVRTNAEGEYAFRGLPSGEYMLRALHLSYRGTTIRDVVTGSAYNIVLEPSATITGRVVRSDTGDSITGYDLQCLSKARAELLEGGQFVLTGLEENEVRVVVKAPGFAKLTTALPVLPDTPEATEAVLELYPIPVIRGQIVDQGGIGVANAELFAFGAAGRKPLAQTGEDGSFVIDSLEYSGPHFALNRIGVTKLDVRHKDYAALSLDVPAPIGGEDAFIRGVLTAGGTVAGRVEIGGGSATPLVVQSVLLWDSQGGRNGARVGATGEYAVKHVAEGPVTAYLKLMHDVDGRYSGGASFTRDAQVVEGKTSRVDFLLDLTSSVEGVVMRGDSPLLISADVRVATEFGEFYHHGNTQEGRYRADGLPPGEAILQLTVWESDYRGLRATPEFVVQLDSGQTVKHNVTFPANDMIQGVVTGIEAGESVDIQLIDGLPSGGSLTVDGPIVASVGVSDSGAFSLPALPGSAYTVMVLARTPQTGGFDRMGSAMSDPIPAPHRVPSIPLTASEMYVRRAYQIVDLTNGQPAQCDFDLSSADGK